MSNMNFNFNFNFNCDVCGRELQCCTWVNGMKLCAKCYQEIFGGTDKDRKIAEQQQRISELEEQLKNAIVPKFKIGQNVWTIRHNNYIYNTRIDEIKVVGIDGKNEIFYYYDQPGSYAHCEEMEDNLFATKAEAEAKLKELGENK